MATPFILVLHNRPLLSEDHPEALSENTIVEIATNIADILKEAGYRTQILELDQDPTVLWTELKRQKVDLVFNLFEGNLNNSETESYVAGLLHWSGVPFTGSPLSTLSLARAKHTTKCLLKGIGLPTADFFVVETLPVPPCSVPFPVIVKPATQDASVGLSNESVCIDQAQLDKRVQYIYETYGPPILVERFIQGRELHIALMELPDLIHFPPTEILFPKDKPGFWPILTFNCKWLIETGDYQDTPSKYPADAAPELTEMLGNIAKKAFRALGCRDYARVDFRVDEAGQPYILEVNPNPEISPYAGFGECVATVNLTYPEFILKIARKSLDRAVTHKPTFLMDQYPVKKAESAPAPG